MGILALAFRRSQDRIFGSESKVDGRYDSSDAFSFFVGLVGESVMIEENPAVDADFGETYLKPGNRGS